MNSAGDDNGVELAKHMLPRRQGLLVYPLPARQQHAHAQGQAARMLIFYIIQADFFSLKITYTQNECFLKGRKTTMAYLITLYKLLRNFCVIAEYNSTNTIKADKMGCLWSRRGRTLEFLTL